MDNPSKTDEKRKKIIKIRNGKNNISPYSTGINKLLREYCE